MASHAAARPSSISRVQVNKLLTRLALLAFIGGLGYLTVLPLIRLQYLALKGGAHS